MHRPTPSTELTISALARDTGISKETLRAWERRYGFPNPSRNAHGDRIYPAEQAAKLQLMKRLIDQGMRPSQIAGLTLGDIQAIADQKYAEADRLGEVLNSGLLHLSSTIQCQTSAQLKQALGQRLLAQGLKNFILQTVAPLTTFVGEEWLKGNLTIADEHFYTDCVSNLLRHALTQLDSGLENRAPKILMTTFPNELHGLGLQMAQCIMALEGAKTVALGTNTPIIEIVHAAKAHNADIVALSFSSTQNQKSVITGLRELRHSLPDHIAIWSGGRAEALCKVEAQTSVVIQELGDIASHIRQWQATH